jgi:hypothetical protein
MTMVDVLLFLALVAWFLCREDDRPERRSPVRKLRGGGVRGAPRRPPPVHRVGRA